MSLIDTLVRGYRLTGATHLLDRAKLHWDRGSKALYGDLNKRIAADNEVARFVKGWFLSDDIFYFSNGDLSYAQLLFYDFGREGSGDAVPPAAAANLSVR